MKKSIAVFIMFAIISGWVGVFIFGDIVFAGQEGIVEDEGNSENHQGENEYIDNVAEDTSENSIKKSEENKELVLNEIENKQETILNEKSNLAERRGDTDSEKEDRVSLQIPEKLEITIDPFEISGKGQIYSREYSIKNCGEVAGVLKLTNFMCIPNKNSGVIIKSDNNGIHKTNEKFAYMEILFGNGDRITLPSEEAEYDVYLKPGEKVSFFYKGEVNENAIQGWKEHDFTIGMMYFWNIEKEILNNETNIKDEEISVFDSENLKNVTKKEDESDVPENIDSDDINFYEKSSFEEDINKESKSDEKN